MTKKGKVISVYDLYGYLSNKGIYVWGIEPIKWYRPLCIYEKPSYKFKIKGDSYLEVITDGYLLNKEVLRHKITGAHCDLEHGFYVVVNCAVKAFAPYDVGAIENDEHFFACGVIYTIGGVDFPGTTSHLEASSSGEIEIFPGPISIVRAPTSLRIKNRIFTDNNDTTKKHTTSDVTTTLRFGEFDFAYREKTIVRSYGEGMVRYNGSLRTGEWNIFHVSEVDLLYRYEFLSKRRLKFNIKAYFESKYDYDIEFSLKANDDRVIISPPSYRMTAVSGKQTLTFVFDVYSNEDFGGAIDWPTESDIIYDTGKNIKSFRSIIEPQISISLNPGVKRDDRRIMTGKLPIAA